MRFGTFLFGGFAPQKIPHSTVALDQGDLRSKMDRYAGRMSFGHLRSYAAIFFHGVNVDDVCGAVNTSKTLGLSLSLILVSRAQIRRADYTTA